MFKSYITAGLPPAYCVPRRHVSGDGVLPRPKSSVCSQLRPVANFAPTTDLKLPLVNIANLYPISHRVQVIADYWSNFRCRQESVSLHAFIGETLHQRSGNLAPINYKHRCIVQCKAYFDILKPLGVTHKSVPVSEVLGRQHMRSATCRCHQLSVPRICRCTFGTGAFLSPDQQSGIGCLIICGIQQLFDST